MNRYSSDTVAAILAQMGFPQLPDDELREIAARLDVIVADLNRLDAYDLCDIEPWPGLVVVLAERA